MDSVDTAKPPEAALHLEEKDAREPGNDAANRPRLTGKTILALCSLILLYQAYLTTLLMPAAILSYINADIGPSSYYSWIVVCWNLGAAVIVTVGGRLADIFGRRWFLLIGASLGAVGALVGATAKHITQMVFSGIIFGIGGGFQEMVFACGQELVPNRYRFFVLGLFELSNIVSSFNPLLSYVFIEYTAAGWRTCYWWAFGFEVASVIALFLFYKPPSFETKHSEDQKTKTQLLKELDYVGQFIFIAACTLLLFGLNSGGSLYPWKSAAVISTIIIGVVLFVVLGFWEVYSGVKYPILPPKLFRKFRDFNAILITVFIAGMLYYSMNVLWPRQSSLLFVPANEVIIRGVYSNMVSFGTIIGTWYCAGIMPWIGHERWQLVGIITVQTTFIGALSSVGINDKAQAIAMVIIVGAANLPTSPIAFGMISLGLEDQTDIGVSNGIVSTFRLIGGAVATAMYTSIETTHYSSVLPGKVEAAAQMSGFSGSIQKLLKAAATNTVAAYDAVPGINNATIAATQMAVKQSYVEAFRLVYLIAIAFGALALASALSTRSVDKSKKTNERAAILETEKV